MPVPRLTVRTDDAEHCEAAWQERRINFLRGDDSNGTVMYTFESQDQLSFAEEVIDEWIEINPTEHVATPRYRALEFAVDFIHRELANNICCDDDKEVRDVLRVLQEMQAELEPKEEPRQCTDVKPAMPSWMVQ